MEMNYAIKVNSSLSYEEARQKVAEYLKEEGFGILTEIDVKDTMHKKLGKVFKKYTILGACNPPFAYKTLTEDEMIGVFLPCNVVVYEEGEGSVIAAMNPEMMSGLFDNEEIREVGEKVAAIMKSILEKLSQE
ncbi:MAG: DUF302 domain-containing protein [Firmicutes bacterium]|nr:DUF302 domain-containing protein [Bacillota bacterium]